MRVLSQDPNWKLADGINNNGIELASREIKITDWITVDANTQDQSTFVSVHQGLQAKNSNNFASTNCKTN